MLFSKAICRKLHFWYHEDLREVQPTFFLNVIGSNWILPSKNNCKKLTVHLTESVFLGTTLFSLLIFFTVIVVIVVVVVNDAPACNRQVEALRERLMLRSVTSLHCYQSTSWYHYRRVILLNSQLAIFSFKTLYHAESYQDKFSKTSHLYSRLAHRWRGWAVTTSFWEWKRPQSTSEKLGSVGFIRKETKSCFDYRFEW